MSTSAPPGQHNKTDLSRTLVQAVANLSSHISHVVDTYTKSRQRVMHPSTGAKWYVEFVQVGRRFRLTRFGLIERGIRPWVWRKPLTPNELCELLDDDKVRILADLDTKVLQPDRRSFAGEGHRSWERQNA